MPAEERLLSPGGTRSQDANMHNKADCTYRISRFTRLLMSGIEPVKKLLSNHLNNLTHTNIYIHV